MCVQPCGGVYKSSTSGIMHRGQDTAQVETEITSVLSDRQAVAKTDVIVITHISHRILVNKHEVDIATFSNAAEQLSRLCQLTALQTPREMFLLYACSHGVLILHCFLQALFR